MAFAGETALTILDELALFLPMHQKTPFRAHDRPANWQLP